MPIYGIQGPSEPEPHYHTTHVRLTEVRKSARGTLRYARRILVYGVAGLETFFLQN